MLYFSSGSRASCRTASGGDGWGSVCGGMVLDGRVAEHHQQQVHLWSGIKCNRETIRVTAKGVCPSAMDMDGGKRDRLKDGCT